MPEPLAADEQHQQIRMRCSGWYRRRRDAINSVNYWRNDYYKRGYRCHRGEESDAKA